MHQVDCVLDKDIYGQCMQIRILLNKYIKAVA